MQGRNSRMTTGRPTVRRKRPRPVACQELPSMRSQGMVISFVTLIATSAMAADFGTTLEDHDGDGHATVLRETSNFAEQGRAEAQPMLDLLYENGTSGNGVITSSNDCFTSRTEGGIGFGDDCSGLKGEIRLLAEPHHLEWKCDLLFDHSPIDGDIVRECRSLYQEIGRFSCNPHFGECSFPVRPTRLGPSAKEAPLEPMTWPSYPGLDFSSSWNPDSIQFSGCNTSLPKDGSTSSTNCWNPSYQRLVLAPTLPEFKCSVVSDFRHIDGPISVECLSLFGDTKQITCGPRNAERCLRLTSPSAQDRHALPNGSAESGIRSPSAGTKRMANSPAMETFDRFPRAPLDPVDEPSACNSDAAIDGLPPTVPCHNVGSETLKVALVPPEWKCTVAGDEGDESPWDGAVVYRCLSLFGETEIIRCKKDQLVECSLPARPREQLGNDFKKIPPEFSPLSPNSLFRIPRNPADMEDLKIGVEFEWKCIVVEDTSHVDGLVRFLCLSRYGEELSYSISVTAAIQRLQEIEGELTTDDANDADEVNPSPDDVPDTPGWADQGTPPGESGEESDEDIWQGSSEDLGVEKSDLSTELHRNLHEVPEPEEFSLDLLDISVYFQPGVDPTSLALEDALVSDLEETKLSPGRGERIYVFLRDELLDELIEFAALGVLDAALLKGGAGSVTKGAMLLAKARKRIGPHLKRSTKAQRKLAIAAKVEQGIRKAKLPPKPKGPKNEGHFYYEPPSGYKGGRPPPRKSGGYEDAYGNVWVPGKGANNFGDVKEWDVQLHKNQLKKYHNRDHVNVSLDGKMLDWPFRSKSKRRRNRKPRRIHRASTLTANSRIQPSCRFRRILRHFRPSSGAKRHTNLSSASNPRS